MADVSFERRCIYKGTEAKVVETADAYDAHLAHGWTISAGPEFWGGAPIAPVADDGGQPVPEPIVPETPKGKKRG